ncbi:MAG: hypothetical protein GC180_07550 [Bacteroidetes bacterium]|nr:hypothetical protein [Bacteroidota bacterium]
MKLKPVAMSKKKSVFPGLAIGAAIGTALGVAFDNLTLWLSLGIAVGAGLAISFTQKKNQSKK